METPNAPNVVHLHDLKEITALLVKQHGLTEGLYELGFEFFISVGGIAPNATTLLPGASIAISKIGLNKVEKDGPTTVDAAAINSPKARRKKAS